MPLQPIGHEITCVGRWTWEATKMSIKCHNCYYDDCFIQTRPLRFLLPPCLRKSRKLAFLQ